MKRCVIQINEITKTHSINTTGDTIDTYRKMINCLVPTRPGTLLDILFLTLQTLTHLHLNWILFRCDAEQFGLCLMNIWEFPILANVLMPILYNIYDWNQFISHWNSVDKVSSSTLCFKCWNLLHLISSNTFLLI